MHKLTSHVLVELSSGNKLPNRVRLFKSGSNETTKGIFVYDPSMKKEILNNQKRDGRTKLAIDVNHLSLSDSNNPDAYISVGWFELELDDEGIWATNIEWNNKGTAYLEDKQFRYISPAFNTDENNNILFIENFSITNTPATLNPLPLVASKENKELNTMLDDNQVIELSNETSEDKEDKKEEEEVVEASEASSEEVVEQVEDSDPEDKDKLIGDLVAQVEALQSELMSAQERIAEYEASEIEAEKDSALSEVDFDSEEEKEFLKRLSVDQVKEFVSIKKLSKATEVVIEEAKETKESGNKLVENARKVLSSKPFHSKESPVKKLSALDNNANFGLPSLESIQATAQKLANQRK